MIIILGIIKTILAVIILTLSIDNTKETPQQDGNIQSKQEKSQTRQEIFEQLTKNSWCNKSLTADSLFPDYTDYSFKPDGTYEWHEITDYTPSPSGSGRWNFEQNSAGKWILLYDTGERLPFMLNENNTITLDEVQKDGSFTLDETQLLPCEAITANKRYTEATLPPIAIPPLVKARTNMLTANKWKKSNDLNLEYRPTLIEFKQNFEYKTTYRFGACENNGNWYATADAIVGKSKINTCDQRDPTYAEGFAATILDNGFLLLGDDLYVPENSPLTKGIIWNVPGYSDVVNIKIEYDMPIKASVANTFDVEITNVADLKQTRPLTLQRFSLTHEYIQNYRAENNTIAQVKEIAAKNLENKILLPGETYRFFIEAIFPQIGKQSLYINNLMYGPTQDWDIQQHYFIDVQ